MTPWTIAHQAPLPVGFSRQEYWSGLVFPSPGDPPDPGTEPRSPALQANSLPSEPLGKVESANTLIFSGSLKYSGLSLSVLYSQKGFFYSFIYLLCAMPCSLRAS